MTPTVSPEKLIYGRRLGEMIGKGEPLPWFEDLITHHTTGDCGNAWPDDEFVLNHLRNRLNDKPFESRWKLDIGILVLCTFFDGKIIAAEILPYAPEPPADS